MKGLISLFRCHQGSKKDIKYKMQSESTYRSKKKKTESNYDNYTRI